MLHPNSLPLPDHSLIDAQNDMRSILRAYFGNVSGGYKFNSPDQSDVAELLCKCGDIRISVRITRDMQSDSSGD